MLLSYPGYQRNERWIGASITHAFCFYHKYFVLLAIPSDPSWCQNVQVYQVVKCEAL